MSNTNAIASYFEFNGIKSSDYGIYVNATDIFTTAARSYEQISVPGRNGDIFKDNAKYNNVEVTYHCNIAADRWLGFDDKFYAWARAMTASIGYCDLTDSYRPEILRRGVLSSEIKPSAKGAGWTVGEFDVTFSCKPQLWLVNDAISYNIIAVQQSSINSTTGKKQAGISQCVTQMIDTEPDTTLILTFNGSTTSGNTLAVTVYQYNASGTIAGKETVSLASSIPAAVAITAQKVRIVWDYDAFEYPAYISTVYNGNLIGKLTPQGNIIENNYDNQIYPTITITRLSTMENDLSLTWNDYSITVKPFLGEININCEDMTITDAYGESMDSYVGIYDLSWGSLAYEFPSISAGDSFNFQTTSVADSALTEPVCAISITGMAVTY